MTATGISLMHAGPNRGGSQARIDHTARGAHACAAAAASRGPLVRLLSAVLDRRPISSLDVCDDEERHVMRHYVCVFVTVLSVLGGAALVQQLHLGTPIVFPRLQQQQHPAAVPSPGTVFRCDWCSEHVTSAIYPEWRQVGQNSQRAMMSGADRTFELRLQSATEKDLLFYGWFHCPSPLKFPGRVVYWNGEVASSGYGSRPVEALRRNRSLYLGPLEGCTGRCQTETEMASAPFNGSTHWQLHPGFLGPGTGIAISKRNAGHGRTLGRHFAVYAQSHPVAFREQAFDRLVDLAVELRTEPPVCLGEACGSHPELRRPEGWDRSIWQRWWLPWLTALYVVSVVGLRSSMDIKPRVTHLSTSSTGDAAASVNERARQHKSRIALMQRRHIQKKKLVAYSLDTVAGLGMVMLAATIYLQYWDRSSELGLGKGTQLRNAVEFHKYRFCLVMENDNAENYITEKIVNAFVGGCVPIYYGHNHIFHIFNRDAFIYWNISNSLAMEYALKQIKVLEQDRQALDTMLSLPILAQGETTLEEYFSLYDEVGDGKLRHRIRKMVAALPL
eukprot:COSAG01_NODE_2957_length_6795_cov_8.325119_7_plen_560_part_00